MRPVNKLGVNLQSAELSCSHFWFSCLYTHHALLHTLFRTNIALTKGYEEDVGNKTSFYFFGMKTLSGSMSALKQHNGIPGAPWNPDIRYVFMPEDDWAYKYVYAALTNATLPKGGHGKWENK